MSDADRIDELLAQLRQHVEDFEVGQITKDKLNRMVEVALAKTYLIGREQNP